MMKKLLLVLMMIPVMQQIQAQEEIVKWTFPTGQMGDTIQNGSNALNSTQVLHIEGAGPITMTNGQASGDYAATATGWDNGMNAKNWYINFKTNGYGNVKISSKQRAGGNNGGPINFTLQYKVSIAGTWADVPGGTVTLGNNWTAGVISNLDLPSDCQNQSELVYIRWIMNTNNDILGGSVAATGISKIDEIIVTGSVNTGINNDLQAQKLRTFPNPSTSAFSIEISAEITRVEIYNALGKLMYTAIPDDKIVMVNNALQPGMYFIKARNKGQVCVTKHIVQ